MYKKKFLSLTLAIAMATGGIGFIPADYSPVSVVVHAESTEEDLQAANEVSNLIEKIKETTYTMEIDNALNAYNQLTEEQKALVTNYELLEEAEAVRPIMIMFYKLSDNLRDAKNWPTKEFLENLRQAYDKLTDFQKDRIEYEYLLPAWEKILKEEEAIAAPVTAMIDEMDATNPEEITTAREAYDSLTDYQKALVTNYSKLTEAEAAVGSTEESGTNETKIAVNKITVKGNSKTIAPGKIIQLSTEVLPGNAADKTIKWSTSNKKVATVTSKGLVTAAKNAGGKSVVITARSSDGQVKGSYKLKVAKGVVKKITLSGSKTIKAGKTLKLKARVKATKGAYKTLSWKSSNTKYATVSNKGVIKALKKGKGKTVTITVLSLDGSNKKATKKIKIK